MISKFAPNQSLLVLSVIFGPAARTYKRLPQILSEIEPTVWKKREGVLSFDDAFTGMPPGGAAHRTRVIAFSPQPDVFSLLTANLEDGWSSLAFRLARDLQSKALVLGFCSDRVTYPARFFSWIEGGTLVRDVSVRLEDKWIFHEQGLPLVQEDLAAYKERLIKNRLTNHQLLALANALGASFDPLSKPVGKGVLFFQV